MLFIVLFTKLCVYAKKGRMNPTFLLRTFSKFRNSSSNFGPSDQFESRVHKDRSSVAFMTRSKMTLQCTVPHIRFDFKSGKYGSLPTVNPGLSEFAVITAGRLALLPECRHLQPATVDSTAQAASRILCRLKPQQRDRSRETPLRNPNYALNPRASSGVWEVVSSQLHIAERGERCGTIRVGRAAGRSDVGDRSCPIAFVHCGSLSEAIHPENARSRLTNRSFTTTCHDETCRRSSVAPFPPCVNW
jgi:hypothetical protein